MVEHRLNMRLDPVTRHDLDQLAWRLNVTQAAAVRIALREACERRGIPLPERPELEREGAESP